MEVLNYFNLVFRLRVNNDKFYMFIVGMIDVNMEELIEVVGFKYGDFLIKYLGVFLYGDKIICRINYWIIKVLFYVRRIEFIKLVYFFF